MLCLNSLESRSFVSHYWKTGNFELLSDGKRSNDLRSFKSKLYTTQRESAIMSLCHIWLVCCKDAKVKQLSSVLSKQEGFS